MTRRDIVVGPWGARFMGRRLSCAIGRGGITRHKREGDGATPAGVHRIVGMLYRADRMMRPANWALAIGSGDLWSDDARDPDYNKMVHRPHRFRHERLHRPDPIYDVILITDWNWPIPAPGQGSAIFVHVWRRPRRPTAGCVAFSRTDLQWIVRRIRPESRLIIRG